MSKHTVSIDINGTTVTKEVDSRMLLVHFIREELQMTGTHIGCDTSSCGACTILMNGRSVKSCTLYTVQANGKSVKTIEGMEEGGALHPLQEGFHEEHGLQCGFCTPGMVMTAVAMAKENSNLTESDVRHGLEGNFCRCTGYQNIVESIVAGAKAMQG